MSLLSFLMAGIFFLFTGSDPEQPKSCKDLGNWWLGNRYEAIATIQNTEFAFEQSFQTLDAIGVQKATFYSCGGNGYVIVETSKRTELFKNVPQHVWMEWINANSINGFYHRVIQYNPQYQY